ncbi:UvrD-helicase domain-containing protein [Methanosarcina mazei]
MVAFTFTEKAAQGMKSRVYDRVRQLGGEAIHGYCSFLLENHFKFENQETAFLMRVGWELGFG